MAKIYETKEDYRKDKLVEQAADLRLESEKQSGFGVALIGTSLFIDLITFCSPKRVWAAAVSTVLSVGGAVQIVRSWMTGSKAHNLELERERMGPQTVILPADTAAEPACPMCSAKKDHRPKTLLDYAEQAVDQRKIR